MPDLIFTSDITVRRLDSMGTDFTVGAAAKVLEPEAYQQYLASNEERSLAGLIGYMIKHRHGSPFEHGSLQFFVHAPILVWREWHRHRIGFAYSDYGYDEGMLGMSFNEESGRYKVLEPVFYLPPRDRPMIKVEDWKPGRPKFLTLDEEAKANNPDLSEEYVRYAADAKYQEILIDMKRGYADEYDRYLRQLDRMLDPGLARDNLPVGIYSSCWVTCNPRSLMAFLSLRTHDPKARDVSYPLYEIEAAARKCEAIFAAGWPITYSAFVANGRVGP